MDLDDECNQEYALPIKIYNRPGLDRIRYRIGKYSQFRQYIMEKLDKSEALNGWTHRSSEDPALALLEGACVLGDILTFYQELYANEAFIRTAREKESIADLIRLLGYQISPGLGGTSTFLLEVKGNKPVTLPANLPIKAELEGMEQPVIFETMEEFICYPSLNKFHFYAPTINEKISQDTREFYIDNAEAGWGDKDKEPELKAGDKILIGDLNNTDPTEIKNSEIIIIDSVRQVVGRTVFTIKGRLKPENQSYFVIGYILKEVYRHFGYDSPPEDGVPLLEEIGNATGDKKEFPLDFEVQDLAIGSTIIVNGFFTPTPIIVTFRQAHDGDEGHWLTLIRNVNNIRLDNYKYPKNSTSVPILSGATSIICLNNEIKSNDISSDQISCYDIRLIQFHETSGRRLTIKSMWKTPNEKGSKFNLYGLDSNIVDKLKGRNLTIVSNKKEPTTITNVTVININRSPNSLQVEIDKELDYTDFPLENPTLEVFGNPVLANQGESQSEVLDAGDGRKEFQTFSLSKSPLTHFNSPKDTPPEVPELKVYVNNQLWKRVSSFFDKKPEDQIYIVRQDGTEKSWIQFGDGKTGSRLPSGIDNVLAKYRTGIGASGKLKSETKIKALEKSDQIENINLYEQVYGGTKSENEMKAKEAGPSKIMSLGRLVSLNDYEFEALSVSGVIKASANLMLTCKVPQIVVNVIVDDNNDANGGNGEGDTDKGIPKDLDKILHDYDRCRGMQRYPIDIRLGKFQYVYLEVDYGLDARFLKEIVEKEIYNALGVFRKEEKDLNSTGLFGVKQREFGQDEYASKVEGLVQNINGVLWARVKSMYSLGIIEDPEELEPLDLDIPRLDSPVVCEESRIGIGNCQKIIPHVLRLYHKHLKINNISDIENLGRCQ